MSSIPIVLMVIASLLLAAQGQFSCENRVEQFQGPCENINGSGCEMYGYGHSFFPNNITRTRVEALTVLTAYHRAFYDNPPACSPLADALTCLALLPVCDPAEGSTSLMMPCRSLCAQVYADCNSWIQTTGGGAAFDIACLLVDCDRYPVTGCIGIDHPLVVAATSSPPPSPSPDPVANTTDPSPTVTPTPGALASSNSSDSCPPPDQDYFKSEQEAFVMGWIAFWAVLCFISTVVTMMTFLLDPSRFQYPWRPVIYLALSFNLHAVAYFLALSLGRDLVTCPDDEFVQPDITWHWGHTPCILVFGLLYYTMLSAFLWWLVLTVSWFLSSALQWSNEAVGHLSPFFHVVSWVLPLLMTISLIAARAVSADELTGTCFVVRDDHQSSFYALLFSVILPLIVFLVTGVVFLVIGFVSVLRIRSFMRHGGKRQETVILEKLMMRIGIFVTVYIIPATVVIACFLYELDTRPDWRTVNDTECQGCKSPNAAIFMVRIFMFLLIGALTGVWIWSKKTLDSWRSLTVRLRECSRHYQVSLVVQPRPQNTIYNVDTKKEYTVDSSESPI